MIFFEDLTIGERGSFTRTITEKDVEIFMGISGDNNPIHDNPIYAAKTPFKKPIVHGVLILGVVSALLGTTFPGPGCVIRTMETHFLAPVYHGNTVKATAAVIALEPKNKVVLALSVTVDNHEVITGEVTLTLPNRKIK